MEVIPAHDSFVVVWLRKVLPRLHGSLNRDADSNGARGGNGKFQLGISIIVTFGRGKNKEKFLYKGQEKNNQER